MAHANNRDSCSCYGLLNFMVVFKKKSAKLMVNRTEHTLRKYCKRAFYEALLRDSAGDDDLWAVMRAVGGRRAAATITAKMSACHVQVRQRSARVLLRGVCCAPGAVSNG